LIKSIALHSGYGYNQKRNTTKKQKTPQDMNAKRVLQDLEDKDMDRRDFLKYAGVFVLGIASAKTALGLVLPPVQETQLAVKDAVGRSNSGRGFGRSKYGT